jgi:uncharacterized membrane-anchored protein YjiN (DUF445 family)
MVTTTALPQQALAGEALRRAQLIRARRNATGLLVVVALALVGVTLLTDGEDAWGYVVAALEASMVGGLADWFAVVALFRHPLGIPIPHTAVIPERKDSFGETLGGFVQDNLFTSEAIVERIHGARISERTAAWLAEPDNAAKAADHLTHAAVTIADLLRDDDVHRALDEAIRSRVDAVPLAPLAGRTLQLLTDGGRHQQVLDALIRAADGYLRDNRANLRARFGGESPWWLPEMVEERVFDRLLDGVHRLLHDVATHPDHELRRDFDQRIAQLAKDLETSPRLRVRGEELKHELMESPELRAWTATVWQDVKAWLRRQADDPDSELRGRIADAIAALGTRLGEDPALAARVDEALESVARYVSEQFHDEIGSMVSSTIQRWDGHETASRLELLLGPDLQFIRINGTLVGGLAGLAIHTVVQLVG